MFGGRRERLEANQARWQRFTDISGPMVAGLITGIQNHDSTQINDYFVQLKDFPTVPGEDLIMFSYGLAEDLYRTSEIRHLTDRQRVDLIADYTSWWVPKEYAVNMIGLREIMEHRRSAGNRFDPIAMMMCAFVLCAYLLPNGGANEHVRRFCTTLPPGFFINNVYTPVTPYPRKGRVDPA